MSNNNDAGKFAALITFFGFCVMVMFLFGAYTAQNSELLISSTIAEYKSGKIICAELGSELVCRRKE